jgi:class 3 adenylate cyclase
VKEIAELHGGSVTVHSRFGEGTTFHVTLPLGRAHLGPSAIVEQATEDTTAYSAQEIAVVDEGSTDREDADRANREAEAAFDLTRPTILYAEDNRDLRRHVRDLLRGSYNVFLAVDGRDALTKIADYHPELVISDEMMPNMNGRELLRALRDQDATRSIPIIFLTARAGTDARIESLEAGADDYLAKPFNEGELLARVRSLLRARAQERALEELNRRLEARVQEQVAELVRGGELQRFIPRAVAERVLSGELADSDATARRKITVLCAGVMGFAELSEQLEPEDLAAVTNEYLREITALAVRYGGLVDHVTVDRLTVFFGAPQEMAPADTAWAAAQTALAIRARLRDLGIAWRRRGIGGRLELRAGLYTGYCTVGVFGGDALRSYTAVGAPVTVAALLQEDAQANTIVCGAPTVAMIEDRVEATPRPSRTLRGMTRSVESYEIGERAHEATAHLPRRRDFAFMPR